MEIKMIINTRRKVDKLPNPPVHLFLWTTGQAYWRYHILWHCYSYIREDFWRISSRIEEDGYVQLKCIVFRGLTFI